MAEYLLDTNIVLRLMDCSDPKHKICRQTTESLTTAGHDVLLAPQVIYEFWVVSTRPKDKRGFGWSASRAEQAVDHLLASFPMYEESSVIFEAWRHIVKTHHVEGKRAHDARLVAFKEVHSVPYFITLNGSDFMGLTSGVLTPEQARETV